MSIEFYQPLKIISCFLFLFPVLLVYSINYIHKNKENVNPLHLFSVGMLIVIFAYYVEKSFGFVFQGLLVKYDFVKNNSFLLQNIFIISPIEECFKAIVIYYTLIKSPIKDSVHLFWASIFVGVGYGTFENIIYVSNADFYVSFCRTFSSVPMHMFTSFIWYILFVNTTNLKTKLLYAIPITIHIFYNYIPYFLKIENKEYLSITFGIFFVFVVTCFYFKKIKNYQEGGV